MLDAIRRQRQMEREMQRRRGASRVRLRGAAGADDRAPFECVRLCPDCGWFDWQVDTCVECGASTHDLTHEFAAQAHRDALDTATTPAPPAFAVGRTFGVLALAATFGGAFYLFGRGSYNVVVFTVAGILLGVPIGWLVGEDVARRLSRAVPLLRTERALRRHRSSTGDARARSAPLSGRPCDGWRVVVEYSADGTEGTWRTVIDEQRGVAGTDPLAIDPGAHELSDADADALRRYLRERGFFDVDGDYKVFEVVRPARS